MANIRVEEIQEWLDSLKNWVDIGDSSPKECLVIKFKKSKSADIIDEEMVNKVLYYQSENGHVTISFDETGQISYIEIT